MIKGQVLDTDHITASTVEPDRCLREFADGLQFLGSSLTMGLDPLTFFLLTLDGIVKQHRGGETADTPCRLDHVACAPIHAVSRAFGLRRLPRFLRGGGEGHGGDTW